MQMTMHYQKLQYWMKINFNQKMVLKFKSISGMPLLKVLDEVLKQILNFYTYTGGSCSCSDEDMLLLFAWNHSNVLEKIGLKMSW